MTEPIPIRIPDPPWRLAVETRELREAWNRVWPRASAVPGFEPSRDDADVATLVQLYVDFRRNPLQGLPAVQRLEQIHVLARHFGLPDDDVGLASLFAMA